MRMSHAAGMGLWTFALGWALAGCGESDRTEAVGTAAEAIVVSPKLPAATISCPTLSSGTVYFGSSAVRIWKGPEGKRGPLLLYWHGTGMSETEAQLGFSGAITDVQQNGGVVASFTSTNLSGYNTGDLVWFTGDFNVADNVVACAYKQGLIDPARIFTSGYSAGGLQCASMTYLRSNYIAGALCMSGGLSTLLALTGPLYTLQSKDYVAPVIAAHGASGLDWMVLDFAQCSSDFCADRKNKGGLAVNCNDGGDHVLGTLTRTSTMGPIGWKWFRELTYGASPSYSTLPSYFPSYCTITK